MQFTEQIYKINDQDIRPAYKDGHLWVTNQDMAQVLGVTRVAIFQHIQKLTEFGLIGDETTLWNYRHARMEGTRQVTRTVPYYSEKAVILVAFRSNSPQALAFQSWAADVLLELNRKGVVYVNRHRPQLPDNSPEFADLQAQHAELQGLIDECQRDMNEARVPKYNGNLIKRVGYLIGAQKGTRPRAERPLPPVKIDTLATSTDLQLSNNSPEFADLRAKVTELQGLIDDCQDNMNEGLLAQRELCNTHNLPLCSPKTQHRG